MRLCKMSALLTILVGCAAQKSDSEYTPRVKSPTYAAAGPVVCVDEAHNNSHTATGLYKPFAQLLESDGFRVQRSNILLDRGVPAECAVYVSVNGAGGKTYKLFGLNLPTKSRERRHLSAFTGQEIDSLRAWVERGGSMLLVADHHPYGAAASAGSAAFGVEMSTGFTESTNFDPATPYDHSRLVFSTENRLLGIHPIISGRGDAERVQRVVTFTGQSLLSAHGTPLLLLGDSAIDYTEINGKLESQRAKGNAQAIATSVGRGRVVVLGEAAMLTAQVDDRGTIRNADDSRQRTVRAQPHALARSVVLACRLTPELDGLWAILTVARDICIVVASSPKNACV